MMPALFTGARQSGRTARPLCLRAFQILTLRHVGGHSRCVAFSGFDVCHQFFEAFDPACTEH